MTDNEQNDGKKAKRRLRWWSWAVLVCYALLVLGGAAEVFLRLGPDFGLNDPEERERYYETLKVDPTLFRNRGGLRDRFAGVDVRINQLGLRGPNAHTPKAPGVYRVLLLGDEKTFGWRVPEEKTYAALLQKQLDQYFVGKFEVLNAGVPGYNLTMIAAFLLRFGFMYQPDVVTILLDGADVVGDEQGPGGYCGSMCQGLARYSLLVRSAYLPRRERTRAPYDLNAAIKAKRLFYQIEQTTFRAHVDLFIFSWAPRDDPLRMLAADALPRPATWVWARAVDTGAALAKLPRSTWRTGVLGDYPSEEAHALLARMHLAELTTRAVSFFFVRRDGLPTPRNRRAADEVN